MSIMKIETINCVICKLSVAKIQHSQVTCLKEKCQTALRKRNANRKYARISPNKKNCKCCGENFITNNPIKKYCSTKCSKQIKKLRQKKLSLAWIRKKMGTLDKYANILRENGYIVIDPGKGES